MTSKPFLNSVSKDVRSVTGSNLRSLMVNEGMTDSGLFSDSDSIVIVDLRNPT